MFSRVSATFLYTVFALTVLAAATPNVPNKRWGTPTTTVKPPVTTTITVTAPATTVTESAGNCNTGSLQCCQSTEDASSAAGTALLGLLGVVLTNLNVLLGLDCSPLTVIGVGGGSSCSASPVCCENNNVGGLISIGCIPVIL